MVTPETGDVGSVTVEGGALAVPNVQLESGVPVVTDVNANEREGGVVEVGAAVDNLISTNFEDESNFESRRSQAVEVPPP